MHRAWTVTGSDGVEHRFIKLLDAINHQMTAGGILRSKSWRE